MDGRNESNSLDHNKMNMETNSNEKSLEDNDSPSVINNTAGSDAFSMDGSFGV